RSPDSSGPRRSRRPASAPRRGPRSSRSRTGADWPRPDRTGRARSAPKPGVGRGWVHIWRGPRPTLVVGRGWAHIWREPRPTLVVGRGWARIWREPRPALWVERVWGARARLGPHLA